MRRREVLCGGASLLLALGTSAAAADDQGTLFDNDTVPAMARQLAAKPFKPARLHAAAELSNLEYSAIPDDPLQAGPGAVARPEHQFHRGVLPSRLPLQGPRGHLPGGRRPRHADHVQHRPVHLGQGEAAHRRYRLCRLPPALSAEPGGLLRRGLRLPRRQLFSRIGARPGLRPVGTRPGDQDRRSVRRGIPAVPQLLAGTPGAGRRFHHDPRPARQPERRRRLPLRHPPGPGNGVRHRGHAVSARRYRPGGPGAADQHVLLRPERPRLRPTTGARRCTTPTGWRCAPGRTNASGGR